MTNYELKRRLAGNIISAEDTLAQMRHTLLAVVVYLLDCGFFHDHLCDDEGKADKLAVHIFM